MAPVKNLQNPPEKTGISPENSDVCRYEVPNEFGLCGHEIKQLNILWSKAYKREISIEETLDIFRKVKHFAEIVL